MHKPIHGLLTTSAALLQSRVAWRFSMSARFLVLCAVAVAAATLGGCANKNEGGASASCSAGDGSGGYGSGRASPGSRKDFKSGARDMVYFSSDSSDLTRRRSRRSRNRRAAAAISAIPDHGRRPRRRTRHARIQSGARCTARPVVRNYLARQGVPHARMRTISYGKERRSPCAMIFRAGRRIGARRPCSAGRRSVRGEG